MPDMKKRQLIIFTDLDGTLLDSAYSFEKALPALKLVKDRGVPLIICSSKTRTEIEHCRKELGNDHPFITENGGGIYFPKTNCELRITNYELRIEDKKDYVQIKLGADYAELRTALGEFRSEGFDVKGFGDMSVDEVASLTGLTISGAERAKERDFDEPFIFNGNEISEKKLKERIKAMGFNSTQGDFYHIMGNSDKGRAVEILKQLYTEHYSEITTVALGDSPNDIEMLQKVDYPVVVQKRDGSYHPQITSAVKGCIKADGIGPEGWNKAVTKLFKALLF